MKKLDENFESTIKTFPFMLSFPPEAAAAAFFDV